jgi:hypothetical protein
MDRLTEFIERSNLPFVPYRAGRAQAITHPSAESLGAGAAVAAAASYGEPNFGRWPSVIRSSSTAPQRSDGSAADVLTVVRDPSSLIGSFKIANVAELLGTVDQDRWHAESGDPFELVRRNMYYSPWDTRSRASSSCGRAWS